MTANNDRGLERIKIVSTCRRNETVRASYGEWEQQALFSDEGVATLAVAITATRSPISLLYRDGTTFEVPVEISSLAPVLRITLQWEAPVDLNLHVVEPGGVVGGRGDAFASHSGSEFGTLGRIDLDDTGSGISPFQESYILPNRLDMPSSIFSIYIENVTRGKTPTGDHCQKGQYGQISVGVVIADRSSVKTHRVEFPAPACNVTLSSREYFTKLRL